MAAPLPNPAAVTGPARGLSPVHAVAAVALVAVALAPLLAPAFYVTLLNYIGLYSLATLGLVLLTGVAGQTSFGQAAFVGIGAYTTGVLTTQFALSPWLTLLLALALTLALGYLIGRITLSMGGHYLPVATIAWGLSIYFLMGTIERFGGFTGITGIPAVSLFGFTLDRERHFYYFIWVVVLGALWLCANLLDSRPGRAIRGLKQGSGMVEAFGVHTTNTKTAVFVLAALLACLSGWLYAHLQRFVNPTPFGINQGIEYLFMAVVGGATSVWGAVLGATLITLLKTWLQDLLPKLLGQAGQFEMIVFGILMIVLLQHAREGLLPFLQRWLPRRPRALPPAEVPLARRTMPSPGSAVLRVEGARKTFGGLIAVNEVSFEVAAHEVVGLIGPNGAGKSTCFNLISGALPLTSGGIRFLEQDVSAMSASAIARLGLGRTFQHVKLVAAMSVVENVALGAYLRGRTGFIRSALRLNGQEERAAFAEAMRQLERVGLAAHAHDAAGSLPLGKQRIVEIARALAADPILLLLDEPAAGLRYAEKQQLAALIKALKTDGLTVLLVEHDMEFVMGLVDRLVVLNFGQKLAQGLPEEVQANPAVREAYLGA
ncbi:MAG: branched-chain amino acid ABC transporter ATP-binding protein/permease [Proteobacteria bacterium]|nr:branched-chain amino acid ABC transporter ATP-binding protein/permease [Pseudomonadota bacterium]